MDATDEARRRLREGDPIARAGIGSSPLGAELADQGVRFAAVGGPLEDRWHAALAELAQCIRPLDPAHPGGGAPVLNEGGVYHGAWIESTGTINTEVLTRFAPRVARDTLLLFARHQRDDGLIPYKVTADGPAFSQIQVVTPLARVVWNHHLLTGGDTELLRTMHGAMARMDAWLAEYRDTAGTGGVEAFCTFDTGHDLSPRFWFAPDRAFRGDARFVDPDSPLLPYVAPDLTSNVACQRAYLGRIAAELGGDPTEWDARARESLEALHAQCFDEEDGFFYDRTRDGELVRLQGDVLARVLANEVGDEPFFAQCLRRYLMNTRKFLAHYGFTTVAMDDPRFDHDASRNSWGGPVNFLAQLRAPHAFERHGHVAELALVSQPVLAALAVADRFPQCLDPWSGDAGFTEVYSPSILWFLDAVERYAGILPRPDGEVWFTGLAPTRLDHGAAAQAVAYGRRIDGAEWELVADDERVSVFRDGEAAFSFPRGWRVIADRSGRIRSVVGIGARPVAGLLDLPEGSASLEIVPNERVELSGAAVTARGGVDFVAPVL
ncbi:MGH1-like glycoside hydrolase domain-containing protein [Microbacterium rhizophilus]|uniref:MGH1-like glycoside hydrolase domain-containing protein n=1 Tax=Microbacterium rhizophilus TaxID=3138934 RepID=UPI0031ECACE7